jgi:hypothetical protein
VAPDPYYYPPDSYYGPGYDPGYDYGEYPPAPAPGINLFFGRG